MKNDFVNLLSDYEYLRKENNLKKRFTYGEFKIIVDQARYPISNVIEIFSRYNLQPRYQRNRVWDKKRKSRLIESLIVNVPIPSIFLYEVEYAKYEILDGLQRISTIIEFLSDDFKLEGLDLFPEFNKHSYYELPEKIKNSIHRRYLSATIIVKESNYDIDTEEQIKQFIFERLNTGGMELSNQEVRNALYGGFFNDMLINIVEYPKFEKMVNILEKKKLQMEDKELVLRFFAYKSAYKNEIKLGTKELLDLYAKQTKLLKTYQVEEAEEYFYSLIDIIYELFGKDAFKKRSQVKFEKMIYDTLMLSVSELIDEHGEEIFYINDSIKLIEYKENIIKCNRELFNGKNTAFNNVIERVNFFKNNLLEELRK
ncbi:DUF262 domain-containing protein [Paenibacillus sp. PK4536]|uniref:DUF262 domain-containing protein n=1 Tax=Paenibacillus sp. PK4536 TaxID=3024576 RepID=UPI0023591ABD|nr:DUF262 domain-containing protein [Paenibacillus sp. PK4536]WIM40512.1 DUF262 domain-containing protein [Paenibacillus sp. PK4536]